MKTKSLIVLFSLVSLASADPSVDENALFSDTSSVTSSTSFVDSQKTKSAIEKPSVGFSGTITSAALGSMHRDYFTVEPKLGSTDFSTFAVGNFALDARLSEGFKGFVAGELVYAPITATSGKDTLRFAIPELFVDANVRRLAYIRTGKQVLQWGRCFLWNPTDLVNVEKKSFITKLTAREGTYGSKLSIPFGTIANLYGFVGTNTATRIDSVYGAAKAEVLFGNTEMALSIWGKRTFKPVYGYDISSRLWGIDIAGEVALYRRFGVKKLDLSKLDLTTLLNLTTLAQNPDLDTLVYVEAHDWAPRAALNLGRTFEVMGVPDRLSLNVEGYFNGVGNTDKQIDVLSFASSNPLANLFPPQLLQKGLVGILLASGAYEPNSYSRWYAAAFGTFGKFIIPDLTLSVNGIINLNQECGIVTTGLSYQNLSNFSLGLSLNGYIGPVNTEYTLQNQGLQVQVTAGVAF